jgi:hypothetical protein
MPYYPNVISDVLFLRRIRWNLRPAPQLYLCSRHVPVRPSLAFPLYRVVQTCLVGVVVSTVFRVVLV